MLSQTWPCNSLAAAAVPAADSRPEPPHDCTKCELCWCDVCIVYGTLCSGASDKVPKRRKQN